VSRLFEEYDRVQVTDADGRVYDGVVAYRYSVEGGATAYAVAIGELDGEIFHFRAESVKAAPPPRKPRFREFT
jgi:hypothetical protein